MKIAELMTREVVSVGPEASLKEVAQLLVEHRISGLPVCDEAGRIVGVVSEADILQRETGPIEREGHFAWLFDDTARADARKAAARTAGEAMSSPAITVESYRAAAAAARTMLEEGVNRLPVVNYHGKLVGIVTRADLVRAFVRSDVEIATEIREDILNRVLWVGPEAVQVAVAAGEVTLTGKLETKWDVGVLEELAARVPGVVGVKSSVAHWVDEKRRLPVHS